MMFQTASTVLLETLIPLRAQLDRFQVRLDPLQLPDDEEDEERFGSCMNGFVWPAADR